MGTKQTLSTLVGRRPMAQALMDLRERMPWARSPWAPLTVLTYHHIEQPDASYPFDPDVADATTELFDQQMAWVAANFAVVRLRDLAAAARGQAPLPNNAALITFDDAYKSCVTRALPILRRHQLPATFFVPTMYVDERKIYWWEQIARMLHERQGTAFTLTYPTTRRFIANATGRQALLRVVKDSHNLDLTRLLSELASALRLEWTPTYERRLADELIMTWDDIRTLRDAGMDVGSHSVTHRVLQQIPMGEVELELRTSKRRIEAELGQPIDAIAYPTGRGLGRDHGLRQAVRSAGYALGFANATGISLRRRPDWLDLPRYAMDRALSLHEFRGQLAVPWLTYRAPAATPPAAPAAAPMPAPASVLKDLLRTQWIRRTMKGISRRDAHQRLDLAYRVPDPWHMASAKEQFRFAETNRLLREQFGQIDALFELGCGEGHQTEYLARIARHVTGLDVSATAIERAKQRVPNATFAVGVATEETFAAKDAFDVAVACEVLYYIKDVQAVLQRLDAMAQRGWLITYFDGANRVLSDEIARFAETCHPAPQRATFSYGDVTWTALWRRRTS